MPFDSNGVFSRVMNWTSDQQNGIAIECGRHDAEDNNFAEGFNETFCRDGRAAATGNFNLGNHKIQNLADGIAATDAVTKGQLDASSAAGVSLNTAQTITGEKTFTKEITEKVNMTKGTAPAASMYPKPYKINDSADSMVGNIQFTYGQNMSAGLGMLVYNCNDITDSTPAALQVFNVNGTKYATCPTPTEDTNNSNQIDTVGARNTKLGNYVTLGTAQTITGAKTIANNLNLSATANGNRHIYSDNTSITKGTAPSTNTGFDYVLRDSSNSNIAAFSGWYNSNGNIYTSLSAYTPTQGSTTHADLKVGNYASGRADVVFETPTGVANSCLDGETNSTTSNMVALKGWVNNPAVATNVVHRSGNETIGGVKRFSENILTDINATRNVAPSTTQYGGIGIRDNANNLFASMVASMDTNKNAAAFLRVFNPSNTSTSDAVYMSLHYNADGSTFVTAPASDVVNSIVTTVNKTKAAKGYYELGNGLIVQWGKSQTSNSSGVFTLPKAFTSTNYAVIITSVDANVPASTDSNSIKTGWGVVKSQNTGNFTAFLCNYENSFWWREAEKTVNWIAIGY
jgi:hypothetical protein